MLKNTVKKLSLIILKLAFIFLIIVLVFKLSGLAYGFAYDALSKKPKTEIMIKDVVFEIKKGSSTKLIAKKLEEEGLISNALYFRLMAKLDGSDGKFQVGKFNLNTGMTDDEIISILQTQGEKKNTIKITIPEGYTIAQIADKLLDSGLIKNKTEFLEAASLDNYDYDFIKEIPERENRLQGYLFPSTYEYYDDSSGQAIVSKMLNQFDLVMTDEYKKRLDTLGISLDQMITIASIIEKEVRLPEERARVAGVIYNRLEVEMPLQMCSTVMYVLDKKRDNLLISDTKIQSPYNTYINSGLPIGPIANPGEASIKAALYPEDHDYLYFVLENPETGQHHFSKTLKEHNAAKAKFKQQF